MDIVGVGRDLIKPWENSHFLNPKSGGLVQMMCLFNVGDFLGSCLEGFFESSSPELPNTVDDGSEIRRSITTWECIKKNPVFSDGINYQPQLVSRISSIQHIIVEMTSYLI